MVQTIGSSVLSSKPKEQPYIEIDQRIVADIDRATVDNSSIWTSPDYNKREYIHSFFQYPARMIPAVQRKLIEIIITATPHTQYVLDPFMGSATTLVTCMENGLHCYGQDINPLSILIAKARTGPYNIPAIKEGYTALMNRVQRDVDPMIVVDFHNLYKWFKPKIALELSKLVRSIRQEPQLEVRRFFWVVLAETVRLSSNDRTSTYKLHIRAQEEIDRRNYSAIEIFQDHMEQSIEDFEFHANLLKKKKRLDENYYKGKIEIQLSDSKQSITPPEKGKLFDLLVTSPPYGDNKTTVTYGQSSYLPLQWIDLADIDEKATAAFLRTTCEIDTRSLGGVLSNINTEALQHLFTVSKSLNKVYQKIEAKAPKELRKVAAFFIDINATLDQIFPVMNPNSYQIWTLGNRKVAGIEIPNDQILKELIISKGGLLVKKLEREILNKRMAKKNSATSLMNTEDILIFRKLDRHN